MAHSTQTESGWRDKELSDKNGKKGGMDGEKDEGNDMFYLRQKCSPAWRLLAISVEEPDLPFLRSKHDNSPNQQTPRCPHTQIHRGTHLRAHTHTHTHTESETGANSGIDRIQSERIWIAVPTETRSQSAIELPALQISSGSRTTPCENGSSGLSVFIEVSQREEEKEVCPRRDVPVLRCFSSLSLPLLDSGAGESLSRSGVKAGRWKFRLLMWLSGGVFIKRPTDEGRITYISLEGRPHWITARVQSPQGSRDGMPSHLRILIPVLNLNNLPGSIAMLQPLPWPPVNVPRGCQSN
ncbi:unnamed protein product [Leuciscus chuanchicus]